MNLALLYIILFVAIIFSFSEKYNDRIENFTGLPIANTVKGICIWLVFISHIAQYFKLYNPLVIDHYYDLLQGFLGQMIVVPFMFYSGYGVLLGTKRGSTYIDAIPFKRSLSVLLNFDIAVLLFIVVDWILGIDVEFKQSIMSLVAWDSVGNSNWYIFTIIIMYLITFVSAKIYGYSAKCVILICTLVICYSMGMSFVKPSWWYNTTFAYAFGSAYAYYKKEFDSFLRGHYAILVGISAIIFIFIKYLPDVVGIITNLRSIVFSILVLLITMKLPPNNSFFLWSGKNLFPLYIYQRIPMIVLSVVPIGTTLLICSNPVLYIALCFFITILIAYAHKFIAIKL